MGISVSYSGRRAPASLESRGDQPFINNAWQMSVVACADGSPSDKLLNLATMRATVLVVKRPPRRLRKTPLASEARLRDAGDAAPTCAWYALMASRARRLIGMMRSFLSLAANTHDTFGEIFHNHPDQLTDARTGRIEFREWHDPATCPAAARQETPSEQRQHPSSEPGGSGLGSFGVHLSAGFTCRRPTRTR